MSLSSECAHVLEAFGHPRDASRIFATILEFLIDFSKGSRPGEVERRVRSGWHRLLHVMFLCINPLFFFQGLAFELFLDRRSTFQLLPVTIAS